MWIEPRVVIGPMLVLLGCLFLGIAARLWLVHPLNRVFRLGPFVTERGLRAVLSMRPLFLSLGLFLTTWGAANVIFWTQADGDLYYWPVPFLGALASVFGAWACALSIIAAVRLWRVK